MEKDLYIQELIKLIKEELEDLLTVRHSVNHGTRHRQG